MLFWCLFLIGLTPSVFAQNDGAASTGYDARVEQEELYVVTSSCPGGQEPCVEDRPELGCYKKRWDEKRIRRECEKQAKVRRKFKTDCDPFGKTPDEESCEFLRELWRDVWKDRFLHARFRDAHSKRNFFVHELLKPLRKNEKADPILMEVLSHQKASRSVSFERIRERVFANLTDYHEEILCGPGILPGIDRISMMDQGEQAICYAPTTAMLIDYWMHSHRGNAAWEGAPSPTKIASDLFFMDEVQHEVLSPRSPFRWGSIVMALEGALQRGVCDRREIEDQMARFMRGRKEFSGEDPVRGFLEKIGNLWLEKKWDELAEIIRFWPEVPHQKNRSWEAFKTARNLDEFYSSFFATICTVTPIRDKFRVVEWSWENPPSSKALDHVMGLSLQPLAVGVNFGVLNHHRLTREEQGTSDHGLVIIGTARDHRNRCTYVVRDPNSGPNCLPGYDHEYECRGGNYFIPKSILSSAIQQTYFLVPESMGSFWKIFDLSRTQ